MRRYDEPVQVRLTSGDGDESPVPDAFLWRRRLYVVREAQSSWLEREAWWEAATSPGRRAVSERTVWRVEAGAGRAHGTGVYDLAQAVDVPAMSGAGAPAPGGAVEQGQWWLLCHLD